MEKLPIIEREDNLSPEQIKEKFGYEFIPNFDEYGFAYACKDGKEFKIGKDGLKALPQYESFSYFDEFGFAVAYRQNKKQIFINKNGDQIFPEEFDHARNFTKGGIALVQQNGKYFHIKKDGTPLYSGRYDFADEGSDVIHVLEGTNVHTINNKGEIIETKPASGSWLDYVRK
jgi:hypothetical protein